jgi:hypothetical protein
MLKDKKKDNAVLTTANIGTKTKLKDKKNDNTVLSTGVRLKI